jgi:O-antigen/teichoic acid export membrane protein
LSPKQILWHARTAGGPYRPILVLLISNLLGTAVAGVFFLVASRSFTLATMGGYTVAISIQWVAVGLVGTGLSVATIRLSTDMLTEGDRSRAAGLVVLAVATAVCFSVLAAAAGLAIGQQLLDAPIFTADMLALAILWAGARATLDCIRSGLLADQRFNRVAILMGISAVTGLGALGLAVAEEGPLTVRRLLQAHVMGLSAAAVLGFTLLRPLLRHGPRLNRELLFSLWRYARWPAMSEGTRLLQANVGALLLLAMAGPAEAGLFGLGRYPAYMFEVVAISFYQYWLPTAARQHGQGRLARFFGRQMKLAALVGVAMLLLAVASRPLLPLFGENLAVAAPLFLLNAVDFALFLLIRPIETCYHGLHRPWLELVPRLARLALVVGLAYLLAPAFGAVGMVWGQILSGLVAVLIAAGLLWRRLNRPARQIALQAMHPNARS